MGYYINTGTNFDKAAEIVRQFGGFRVAKPDSFASIPTDKALIVVVDNGAFEAAGFAYNQAEFNAFTEPEDSRPKEYVIMDRHKAEQLTGF